jgi:hypothetical protein
MRRDVYETKQGIIGIDVKRQECKGLNYVMKWYKHHIKTLARISVVGDLVDKYLRHSKKFLTDLELKLIYSNSNKTK